MSTQAPKQMIAKTSLAFFLAFLIFVVYSADRGALPEVLGFYKTIPCGDKLGHFCLMGLFAFLATWATNSRSWPFGRLRIPIGATTVFAIVLLEELSQIHFPGRTFELWDLAADIVGIAVFSWLAIRLSKPPKAATAGQQT